MRRGGRELKGGDKEISSAFFLFFSWPEPRTELLPRRPDEADFDVTQVGKTSRRWLDAKKIVPDF